MAINESANLAIQGLSMAFAKTVDELLPGNDGSQVFHSYLAEITQHLEQLSSDDSHEAATVLKIACRNVAMSKYER